MRLGLGQVDDAGHGLRHDAPIPVGVCRRSRSGNHAVLTSTVLRSTLDSLLVEARRTRRDAHARGRRRERSSRPRRSMRWPPTRTSLTGAIELVYGTDAARAFAQLWEQHTQFFIDYAQAVRAAQRLSRRRSAEQSRRLSERLRELPQHRDRRRGRARGGDQSAPRPRGGSHELHRSRRRRAHSRCPPDPGADRRPHARDRRGGLAGDRGPAPARTSRRRSLLRH